MLYITYKTEHFSFKQGHAMHVKELTKTDWLVVFIQLLKSFITKVPEY